MGHTSRQRLCQREYLSKSADPWVLSECLHNEWDGKRCECIYFFTFTYRIKVMMPSSCTEKSLCRCVYGHKYVMYVCSFLSIHFLNGLWEFTATNQVLGNVMSLHSNRSSAHTHLVYLRELKCELKCFHFNWAPWLWTVAEHHNM